MKYGKNTIVLWLLFCSVFSFAQNTENVKLEIIKKNIESIPEEIVNIPFFISNNSEENAKLNIELILPETWKIISKIQTQNLPAGTRKFQVFSFQVPISFPTGNYKIKINVLNVNTNQLIQGNTFVNVKEKENLILELISDEEYVMGGDTIWVEGVLKNYGNKQKHVYLETVNCTVDGKAELNIQPGETIGFTTYYVASENLVVPSRDYYSVKLILAGVEKQSIYRQILTYPTKNYKNDLYFRYPISASLTYLGAKESQNFQSGFQFEIVGEGMLDPAGKHRLSFVARGPNRADLSFLGYRDQYFISYSNPDFEVTVGQRSYSFTPLTESSRYGLGIENKVKFNNGLAFGMVYVKPVFFIDIKNEIAVYSSFTTPKNNEYNLYYILVNPLGYNYNIYLTSFSAKVEPLKNTLFDFEISRGMQDNKIGYAFKTGLSTQFSIFRLSADYFNIDSNYPGYYSNSIFYSGSVSAQLSEKINVGLYARRDFSNAKLDTFYMTDPYTNSYQAFLNYNISETTLLKAYWREIEKKDRLLAGKFHFNSRSFNTQIRQKFNRIELNAHGEFGKTINLLANTSENKQNTYRSSLSMMYRINDLHTFRAFGSYSNINSFLTGTQRNLTAGLAVRSQLAKNLKLSFNIQNAFDVEYYYRNRNLMQLHIDYRFLKNHSFSFRSYYTLFRQETETPNWFMSATYNYLLGVPLKKIANVGDLKGRIVNSNNEPIQGVKVELLNKTDLTNKNGEFTFNSVRPGIFAITLDNKEFDINEILSIPSPVKVEIIENQQTFVNLRMVKASKLSGKFTLESTEQTIQKNPESLENIIVEIKNELWEYRITTNSDGDFTFPLCVPGTWTLKVYTNSLPDGFETEKFESTVVLEPGKPATIGLVLKPKKRTIVFKQQNLGVSLLENHSLKNLSLNNKNTGQKPEKNNIHTEEQNQNKSQNNSTFRNSDFSNQESFYSIQIGAYKLQKSKRSMIFRKLNFDYEVYTNNLYKYFIGKYNSYEEAKTELIEIRKIYRDAFIVYNNKGAIIQVSAIKQKK